MGAAHGPLPNPPPQAVEGDRAALPEQEYWMPRWSLHSRKRVRGMAALG